MNNTIDEAFDVGTWVGRKQAFALVAGRCSVADAEILFEIREKKLFRAIEQTWEEFCAKRLGLTRSYVDRIIRQFKELGPDYVRLNSFTRITPAEYRRIARTVTEDGLSYGGELITLECENAPRLAEAIGALRREWTQAADPIDPVEESCAKAAKALQSAVAEFHRLQAMKLDDEGRLKLAIALENGRSQLDLLQASTTL
jgi:hypothetical protein